MRHIKPVAFPFEIITDNFTNNLIYTYGRQQKKGLSLWRQKR